MCKYCEWLNNEDVEFDCLRTDDIPISIGNDERIIRTLITVSAEEFLTTHSTNDDIITPVLHIDSFIRDRYGRDDEINILDVTTPINYCPICGERLRDVLVNMEES